MPLPRNNGHTCKKCGKEIDPAQKVTIVSSSPLPGYLPFIVGENISRFKIDSNLYIDPIKEGIRYKNLEQYTSEKIVIRKTGVGIMSSIDYSGALTNQVVYDFYLRGEYKYDGFLELINAILNSRPIYYLIVKRFGELEWRSHPYLTMNQIRELPLPLSNSSIKQLLSENRVTLLALRNTLRYHLEISEELDAEIERMVAKIYSLTKKDYQEIFATLTSIEQLRPVRLLLSIKPDDIFLNE